MESPRKRLTLVPTPEPIEVETVPEAEVAEEPVRLTGRSARAAERANLLALEAAIDDACA
jgi:hypothetical protein